jgi:RNA polymerase sigma factor (sigma-70 family)
MGDVHYVSVQSSLRILFEDGTVTGLTDAQLLDLFVARHDEVAFTALVERHGPMVQRVCHEVLRDYHEAQDAFQATFLVLARHARSIRRRASLASWLHGVALRVAASARSTSARRRTHEHNWAAQRPVEGGWGQATCAHFQEKSREELGMLLHEEIGRLPQRFRAAVVLCYLEGRTYEEAARVELSGRDDQEPPRHSPRAVAQQAGAFDAGDVRRVGQAGSAGKSADHLYAHANAGAISASGHSSRHRRRGSRLDLPARASSA